jgi:hypothetical protein
MKFIETAAYDGRDRIATKPDEVIIISSTKGFSLANNNVANELVSDSVKEEVEQKEQKDSETVSDKELYNTPAESVDSLKNNISGGSNDSLHSLNHVGEDVGRTSRGMGRGIKKI